MSEEWIGVPGWESIYQVSSLGRVRSWKIGRIKLSDPHIKKPQINKNGYVMVILGNKIKYKAWYIHRLVLTAFKGFPNGKLDCCHNDGNKLNNELINLRWATRKENEKDKILHGTRAIGDRNGMRKKKLARIDRGIE